VRSTTNPVPQTAAPHITAFQHVEQYPMTAALHGSFAPMYSVQASQNQAFQMQAMQMEILRLQQLQQRQQYQLDIARQQQPAMRHASQPVDFTAMDAGVVIPPRRVSQAEQLKSQLRLNTTVATATQAPMTASLSGKFGGRLNPHAASFSLNGIPDESEAFTPRGPKAPTNTPVTPGYTTVISGGTPLGFSNGTIPTPVAMTPSKSDSAVSWRRGANISPPNERGLEGISPIQSKARPQPLRFSPISTSLSTVTAANSDEIAEETDENSSSSSIRSDSSPTTPHTGSSASSIGSAGLTLPTSREEASKRLYEGLGLGRPIPQSAAPNIKGYDIVDASNGGMGAGNPMASFSQRVISQPMRQPLGPPSSTDELGARNFASRIRRTIIGDISAMLNARVTRSEIDAF